jgi:hypothetical protein
MNKRIGIVATVTTLCTLLMASSSAAAGTSAAGRMVREAAGISTAAPYCGLTWGSQPKTAGQNSAARLLSTRTGQHSCWDRVVFEFDGPVSGYRVNYGQVSDEAEGLVFNPWTAGGAHLKVQLWAPAVNDNYEPTYPHRNGDHVANVLRYQTLRDVLYGGTHEGYTTFAVGVRAQLPFRLFVLTGPDSRSRIVLDIAHAW